MVETPQCGETPCMLKDPKTELRLVGTVSMARRSQQAYATSSTTLLGRWRIRCSASFQLRLRDSSLQRVRRHLRRRGSAGVGTRVCSKQNCTWRFATLHPRIGKCQEAVQGCGHRSAESALYTHEEFDASSIHLSSGVHRSESA